MAYKIYKLRTGNIHLSEAIADSIITTCLAVMENSDLNFQMWKIGITDNKELTKGNKFRSWPCTSYLEASHTKKYFVEQKVMEDDSPDETGNETFIYVFV